MNLDLDALPEVPRVERLSMKPGDRLVLRFQRNLTDEQFDHVKQAVEQWGFPAGTVIILDSGATLEVLEGAPS